MSIKKKSEVSKQKDWFDKNSSYEEIRSSLVACNFVYKYVYTELVNRISKLDWSKLEQQGLFRYTVEIISEIESMLKQQEIVGGKSGKNPQSIVFIGELGQELEGPAIYVLFHPDMTKQEWMDKFEKLQRAPQSKEIYESIKHEYKRERTRNQVGFKDVEQNIEIYLAIEFKIPKYWEERQKGSFKDLAGTGETITVPVFEAALEDVIASRNIEDPKKEDELRRKYREIYYAVSKRYKLLTLRDLPRFIKLLNEIGS